MNDLFSLVDWSRAQFALTAIYHWLFVPLTLGLGVIVGIMETIYYRRRTVENDYQVLDDPFRSQFCNRSSNGYYPRISVRHELVEL